MMEMRSCVDIVDWVDSVDSVDAACRSALRVFSAFPIPRWL